jgi:hypothetical protein
MSGNGHVDPTLFYFFIYFLLCTIVLEWLTLFQFRLASQVCPLQGRLYFVYPQDIEGWIQFVSHLGGYRHGHKVLYSLCHLQVLRDPRLDFGLNSSSATS